ncbi:hypothetical protein BC834DRAFT_678441 [Gloeopeniophorella convolvens]|nr:hypothetical protein BC834DRAFT_678441 [Gloeopeniophorella convolvens]
MGWPPVTRSPISSIRTCARPVHPRRPLFFPMGIRSLRGPPESGSLSPPRPTRGPCVPCPHPVDVSRSSAASCASSCSFQSAPSFHRTSPSPPLCLGASLPLCFFLPPPAPRVSRPVSTRCYRRIHPRFSQLSPICLIPRLRSPAPPRTPAL